MLRAMDAFQTASEIQQTLTPLINRGFELASEVARIVQMPEVTSAIVKARQEAAQLTTKWLPTIALQAVNFVPSDKLQQGIATCKKVSFVVEKITEKLKYYQPNIRTA